MTLTVENRDQLFLERENELNATVSRLSRQSFRMSTFRMTLFLLSSAFFSVYFIFFRQIVMIVGGTISFLTFIALIAVHFGIKKELSYSLHLRSIHDEYKARIRHSFEKLNDDGSDFSDSDHDYSGDLDLFGHGSIFHLLSTAETFFGRTKLRDRLLASSDPGLSATSVSVRQKAISELIEEPWRLQAFQAKGRMSCKHKRSPKAFLEYASAIGPNDAIRPLHLLIYASLSILGMVTLILSLLSVANLYPVFPAVLIIQLLLTASRYNRFKGVFESTEGLHRELYIYKELFEHIENEKVNTPLLSDLQKYILDIQSEHGGKASGQLARLHVISLFIQARNQPLLFLILNMFFLYDMYCVYFLNRWIRISGSSISENLERLGDWEALGSLSMMQLIYPECNYPIIREGQGQQRRTSYFSAKEMGHPLIPTDRQIRNDFDLPGGVALITGSNMSGKTTLLRTVGINAVLAYAGAICCAQELEIGIMDIGSSMRITDNLEAGLSTFYAELIRIERIIRRSKSGAPLLFLIDEIFRGTNSKDRTDGAQIVIRNLLLPQAIGIMSTHDYQLCETLRDEREIKFYHFSEKYDEHGIHFDYKLSPGISKDANARYLMKLVGIE